MFKSFVLPIAFLYLAQPAPHPSTDPLLVDEVTEMRPAGRPSGYWPPSGYWRRPERTGRPDRRYSRLTFRDGPWRLDCAGATQHGGREVGGAQYRHISLRGGSQGP
jgi:hypothetical protein